MCLRPTEGFSLPSRWNSSPSRVNAACVIITGRSARAPSASCRSTGREPAPARNVSTLFPRWRGGSTDRPAAPPADGVAARRGGHRLAQRGEAPTGASVTGEDQERPRARRRDLRLARLLEPLLIPRPLLPAVVPQARADQVEVGAPVLG